MSHPELGPGPGGYKDETAPVAKDPVVSSVTSLLAPPSINYLNCVHLSSASLEQLKTIAHPLPRRPLATLHGMVCAEKAARNPPVLHALLLWGQPHLFPLPAYLAERVHTTH